MSEFGKIFIGSDVFCPFEECVLHGGHTCLFLTPHGLNLEDVQPAAWYLGRDLVPEIG